MLFEKNKPNVKMETVFFANSSRLILSLFLLPKIFAISCKEQSFEADGMPQTADSFLMVSRRFQTLCYKADFEAALRTSSLCGFQLLDLYDFHGQEVALVGVLDPFWEEKGYIPQEEHSKYCNETVLLARFKKMIFKNYKKN